MRTVDSVDRVGKSFATAFFCGLAACGGNGAVGPSDVDPPVAGQYAFHRPEGSFPDGFRGTATISNVTNGEFDVTFAVADQGNEIVFAPTPRFGPTFNPTAGKGPYLLHVELLYGPNGFDPGAQVGGRAVAIRLGWTGTSVLCHSDEIPVEVMNPCTMTYLGP